MNRFTVRSLFASSLMLLLTPMVLLAQESTIRGSIVDSQGDPIGGAAVQVRGTDTGTLAGSDGDYSLSVPAGTHTIEASAIGHRRVAKTVQVSAGETRTADFTLRVSAVELGEIVASVEAGEVTRREMGTDIASIDVAEQIDAAVVTSVSDLLNARTGGVQVTQASGNVGSGSRIRVRGINSLTQDNNPLFIIDGVRASNDTEVGINRGQTFSRFDDLEPQDIKSIQVVKGPAATALYGSEAASGVIIVETKTGSAQRDGMRIDANIEQGGFWDVTEYPDNYADATAYVTGADDPRLNGWSVEQNPLTGQVFVTDNPFEDTDSSPFRRGRSSKAGVQVSGGGDNVSYFTSVGYDDRTGVLPSNDLERVNFRANFRATPNDKVDIVASSGYVTSETNLPKSGGNTSGYFANAQDGVPMSALGTSGECLATVLAGTDPSFCDKNGNTRAAFDKIAPITSREEIERFTGSLRVNYTPFSWLTNAATLGADVIDQSFTDAIPYDPDVPFSFAAGGERFITRSLRRNLTADISSTASFDVTDRIGSRTAVGAQYFQDLNEVIACEGRVFVNDQATACDAAVSLRGFSNVREKVEIGAYFQERLSYNDYFFVTGALRVDDNSALGSDVPAIWSPSFNSSLVVSDLPQWNVDSELVSDLRLRAAWGKASQSPQQYAADRNYGIVRLARDGEIVAGLSPQDPGNPDLGPERNTELELGFDAGFVDGRVGLDATFFQRTTHDAIVRRPVAPSTGFANSQFVNLGALENTGLEATLDAVLVDRDDVFWDLQFVFSSTRSKVTELGLDNPVYLGFSQWLIEGYAPGAYVSNVITSAERDENGDIVPESVEYAPGNFREGSNLRVIGQPFPTNEQSLSTSVTLFGDLRISATFDRAAGHDLYSDGLEDRNPGRLGGINSRFGEMWAYRQTRLSPVEQATIELDDRVGRHDAMWIRDANFTKFRELKVAYTLPRVLAARFGTARASIYVGARNLVTWTDYPGLDPELNERGARDNLRVVEDNTLPPPRMIFSGINVSF